jgi:hypothetical protein
VTEKTRLRPTTDPTTGKPFEVWLPPKQRTIDPAGERLVVDAYISRRILSGELEVIPEVDSTPAPTPPARNINKPTPTQESTP